MLLRYVSITVVAQELTSRPRAPAARSRVRSFTETRRWAKQRERSNDDDDDDDDNNNNNCFEAKEGYEPWCLAFVRGRGGACCQW